MLTVNGIFNPDAGAQLYKDVVTDTYPGYLNNGTSTYVQNGSGIPIVSDLTQVGFEEHGATDIAVHRTADALNVIAKQAKSNHCCCPTIHVFAHSQGTQIVFNALGLLSRDVKSMIDYQGFGGEILLGNNLGLFAVHNYWNEGDPVPSLGSLSPFKALGYLMFQPVYTKVNNNFEGGKAKAGNHHTFRDSYKPSLPKKLPTRRC